jgi:MFS family permease
MELLGAVALLPQLLLGLAADVWVDRAPYRRTLIMADLARTSLLGAIRLLAALGALRIWQLYAVAVLAGVADLFDSVTVRSFTPRLVPRERLLPANSALMLSSTTVATTGSAVGLRATLVVSGGTMLLGTAIAYLSPLRRVSPPSVGRVA